MLEVVDYSQTVLKDPDRDPRHNVDHFCWGWVCIFRLAQGLFLGKAQAGLFKMVDLPQLFQALLRNHLHSFTLKTSLSHSDITHISSSAQATNNSSCLQSSQRFWMIATGRLLLKQMSNWKTSLLQQSSRILPEAEHHQRRAPEQTAHRKI